MNSSVFLFVYSVHGFYTCVRYLYLVVHIRVIICIYLVSSNICVYVYIDIIYMISDQTILNTQLN